MLNKKWGMKQLEFTPNLKSLIARFWSIMARHFLLNF